MFFKKVIDFIFPPVCGICGKPIKNNTNIVPIESIVPGANMAASNHDYTIMPEDVGQVLVFTVTATSEDGTTATASYNIPVVSS